MLVLWKNTPLNIRVYDESRIMAFTQVEFMPKMNYKKVYWFSSSETLKLITRNHEQ